MAIVCALCRKSSGNPEFGIRSWELGVGNYLDDVLYRLMKCLG